jgi:uncharacterized protein YbjQ (UPF0145 family)
LKLRRAIHQSSNIRRKIGRHRRVLMKDVLAYKKTMQVNRRAALDELVKASEDAGGYDL